MAAAAAAVVFAATAIWVAVGDRVPGDRTAVHRAHELLGTCFDAPARAVGLTGSAWVLGSVAVVLAVACVVRRAWGALVLVVGAATLTWLVNPALKPAFGRDRPAVRDFVEPTSRYAFPSGHAVGSAAFAAVVVLLAWRTRWRWPVVAGTGCYVALVGASRIVLGVHFPSDLVAGWALAIAGVVGLGAWVLVPAPSRRSDCGA